MFDSMLLLMFFISLKTQIILIEINGYVYWYDYGHVVAHIEHEIIINLHVSLMSLMSS